MRQRRRPPHGGDLDDVLDALASEGMRRTPAFVAVAGASRPRVVTHADGYAVLTSARGTLEVRAHHTRVWSDLLADEDVDTVALRVSPTWVAPWLSSPEPAAAPEPAAVTEPATPEDRTPDEGTNLPITQPAALPEPAPLPDLASTPDPPPAADNSSRDDEFTDIPDIGRDTPSRAELLTEPEPEAEPEPEPGPDPQPETASAVDNSPRGPELTDIPDTGPDTPSAGELSTDPSRTRTRAGARTRARTRAAAAAEPGAGR